MDLNYRKAERQGDLQTMFRLLCQQDKTHDALDLVKRGSVGVDGQLSYWYKFRYMRVNGAWYSHASWVAPEIPLLVPKVAYNVRPSYLDNSASAAVIRDVQPERLSTRGQVIKIMMLTANFLPGGVLQIPGTAIVECPKPVLVDFIAKVTLCRAKIREEGGVLHNG